MKLKQGRAVAGHPSWLLAPVAWLCAIHAQATPDHIPAPDNVETRTLACAPCHGPRGQGAVRESLVDVSANTFAVNAGALYAAVQSHAPGTRMAVRFIDTGGGEPRTVLVTLGTDPGQP